MREGEKGKNERFSNDTHLDDWIGFTKWYFSVLWKYMCIYINEEERSHFFYATNFGTRQQKLSYIYYVSYRSLCCNVLGTGMIRLCAALPVMFPSKTICVCNNIAASIDGIIMLWRSYRKFLRCGMFVNCTHTKIHIPVRAYLRRWCTTRSIAIAYMALCCHGPSARFGGTQNDWDILVRTYVTSCEEFGLFVGKGTGAWSNYHINMKNDAAHSWVVHYIVCDHSYCDQGIEHRT